MKVTIDIPDNYEIVNDKTHFNLHGNPYAVTLDIRPKKFKVIEFWPHPTGDWVIDGEDTMSKYNSEYDSQKQRYRRVEVEK